MEKCCKEKMLIYKKCPRTTNMILPYTARCKVCGRWFDVSRTTVIDNIDIVVLTFPRKDLYYAKDTDKITKRPVS